MKVLQIGSDRTIFDSSSASAARMRAYGKRFGKLEMIIFSLRKHKVREACLSEHTHVYATNSFFRFLYVWDAVWLAFTLPKPDVVSVQDPFETGITGWIVARLRGAALHVQVHTDFLSPEFFRLSFLNRLRVLIAGFVLRRASRVRVVSERIRDSLKTINSKSRRFGRDPDFASGLKTEPSVLPIFVDVEKYRNTQLSPALAAREHLFRTKLLVVSRLEPEKNVGLAIHAFAKTALEKSCLIIVGEGSEKEALHKMADLLLAPSRYEGYGMAIVEALASGTPVLATDVGVAREAGAIIAAEDDFAKALTEWHENGPREGKLTNYPYRNFEEYVRAYCKDIESS